MTQFFYLLITDSYVDAEANLPRRTRRESKRRNIKLPGEADTTAADSVSENEEKESEATTIKRKTAQNKSGTPNKINVPIPPPGLSKTVV